MQKLHIEPSVNTPEIIFSPDEKFFMISGTSAPEDVRALYYPVIDWFINFSNEILDKKTISFSVDDPLSLKIDLKYFNSSSAKFLHDLLTEVKKLIKAGVPASIEWYYDEDDSDNKEAGTDLSLIAELEFRYIEKKR